MYMQSKIEETKPGGLNVYLALAFNYFVVLLFRNTLNGKMESKVGRRQV